MSQWLHNNEIPCPVESLLWLWWYCPFKQMIRNAILYASFSWKDWYIYQNLVWFFRQAQNLHTLMVTVSTQRWKSNLSCLAEIFADQIFALSIIIQTTSQNAYILRGTFNGNQQNLLSKFLCSEFFFLLSKFCLLSISMILHWPLGWWIVLHE